MQDLPQDLKEIFGDTLVNVWRCRDMHDLATSLKGEEGSQGHPAVHLKLHTHRDGSEHYSFVFAHAQSSFRV